MMSAFAGAESPGLGCKAQGGVARGGDGRNTSRRTQPTWSSTHPGSFKSELHPRFAS